MNLVRDRLARLSRLAPPLSLLWVTLGVLTALYVAISLMVFAYAQGRVEAGLDRRIPIPDQVAAIIAMMDAADAAQRTELLRALNGSEIGVRLLADWPADRRQGERARGWIAQTIRGYLPPEQAALMDDAAIWFPPRAPPRWIVTEVQLLVPLSDGRILEISVRDRWVGVVSALWFIGILGVIGVILAAGLIVVLRRILAPLSLVAAAADRLGGDTDSPPMPETGPAELRRVARAFNAMRARVNDLVQQRTRMLAGIAHDLRSVLTRQRLRLEALPDAGERAKAVADLDFMLRVIDTHLDFAKADAPLEPPTRFDLAELVRDLVEDADRPDAPTSFDGPRHVVVEGRPDALRRAITNLIDNAQCYGGQADVGLALDGAAVVLEVADRGPGVPAAQRDAVFAPYRRAGDAQSAGGGHFGLGLATTRALIRRHGGDVAILDRDGGGAIVQARWPICGGVPVGRAKAG